MIRCQTGEPPVVEDQQINARQRAEQTREAAIAVRQLQLGEQPGHARVMDAIAVATGFLRQRTTEPRLADATWSGDQQVAMIADPAACRELLEQRLIELARRSIVDVLDRRLAVAKPGGAQAAVEPLGAAMRRLAIERQCEPVRWRQVLCAILRG